MTANKYLKCNDFFDHLNYKTLYSMWECFYFTDLSEKTNLNKFFVSLENYLQKEYGDTFKEDKDVTITGNRLHKNNTIINGIYAGASGVGTTTGIGTSIP